MKISRVLFLSLFLGIASNLASVMPAFAATRTSISAIIIGDNFTNGSGIENEQDRFLTLLNKRFKSDSTVFKQYSQNGATTATALTLMDRVIRERPDVVVVAVGANDALTSSEPDVIYSNLDTLVRELLRNGIYVIVFSVQAPPTVSQDYAMLFNGVFPRLAQQHRVLMVDGIYQSYMGNRDLTQFDLIHPNKQGAAVMVDVVRKGIDKDFISKFRNAKRRAAKMANPE